MVPFSLKNDNIRKCKLCIRDLYGTMFVALIGMMNCNTRIPFVTQESHFVMENPTL